MQPACDTARQYEFCGNAAPTLSVVTALIYVILIAVWAVVLVPRFLRHHDESKRRRETDRLQAALAPEPPSHGAEHRAGSWAEYLLSLSNIDASHWIHQVRAPQGQHARRRRTVVMALGGTTAVAVLGAVIGVLPGFVAVFAAMLLGGYIAAMFTQMRRWESAGSAAAPSAAAQEGASYESAQRARRSTDGVRVVRHDQDAGAAWDPRETTLPTYVSKPKASKIPRRIDLTHDRAGWTGADMVEQARRQQHGPDVQEQYEREFEVVAPDQDQEVAQYAYPDEDERYYRRAVNE